jgi:hypothetical protein
LSGTHQPLVYVDEFNILGENINILNKITQAPIEASKEVGLAVNAEKQCKTYVYVSSPKCRPVT